MKYSVWMVPPEPVAAALQATINELAKKYDAPPFEPHMTVVGGIEVSREELEKSLSEISATTAPFAVVFDSISFSTTYFQSVFVRVKSSSSLMQLNMTLKKTFALPNEVFMPHISLLYGDHDMSVRGKIAEEIRLPAESFLGEKLIIVPADSPDPQTWQHLFEVSLKGK